MISRAQIKSVKRDGIEDYYDYVTSIFHSESKERALGLLFKANRKQLFEYFLLLTQQRDLEALQFFLEGLKDQAWTNQ